MSTQEDRAKQALERAFPDGLTAQQIEAIVRFSKLVRFRARSNNALFPMLYRVFGHFFHADFKKVQAVNHRGDVHEAIQTTVQQEDGLHVITAEDDREEG